MSFHSTWVIFRVKFIYQRLFSYDDSRPRDRSQGRSRSPRFEKMGPSGSPDPAVLRDQIGEPPEVQPEVRTQKAVSGGEHSGCFGCWITARVAICLWKGLGDIEMKEKQASHNFPDGSIFTIGFTIGYLWKIFGKSYPKDINHPSTNIFPEDSIWFHINPYQSIDFHRSKMDIAWH